MDPLGALLDGTRARTSFQLRTVLAPPWAIAVEDEAPLTLITVVQGAGWVVDDTGAVRVGPGDVALVRGPAPYVFADDPGSIPQVRIDRDQQCWSTRDGRSLASEMDLGVRTWGNTPPTGRGGSTTIALVGAYSTHSQVAPLLLEAVPRTVVVPAIESGPGLAAVLADEIVRDGPGQEVVLDRLLDLLLVSTLRQWFATAGRDLPSWWRAVDDPLVGPVVTALQADPAQQWTVDRMARLAGLSRAGFAKRFHDVAGLPPMTFLTQWRLSLAADRLCDTDSTVSAIAREVGYASAFSLSAAFTRAYAVSPAAYRRRAARLSS